MPETLSQSQIDELLKRAHAGEVNTESEQKTKIKEYDFKSPKKFTKEQLKALDSLHENFSRVLSSYFTSILRSVCEISVLQIEEQRYYEFNNALPDNALVGIIDFKPENKKLSESFFMMDLSSAFGFLLVERLLGGSEGVYIPERDFTEIELAITRSIIEKMTEHLKESWCNYLPVETTLSNVETNSRLLQVYAPQDIMVLVSLNVKMSDFQGTMTLCLPAESLESVMGFFKLGHARAVRREDPEEEKQKKEGIIDTLKQSDLEIKAVLDQFQMSLGDILQLQVNDVIALNKTIDSNVSVMVDGKSWYYAKLGRSKLKKAVKLIDIIAG